MGTPHIKDVDRRIITLLAQGYLQREVAQQLR